ncbi:hypothetical protein AB0M39_40365 [Streptomyces sp. NPDC051907]|uniref:hypothetical protein n=1 Tax=Streptomyces sp. NPDC051907 TaxID=3155284 RepID=UPI0034230677
MKRDPRHVVVDGEPLVALEARDFENLIAVRRQLGGQGAKLRSLRCALVDLTDFLEELGTALRGDGQPSLAKSADAEHAASRAEPTAPGTDRRRPVDDLSVLLADLPERVRHARSITGGRGVRARKEP